MALKDCIKKLGKAVSPQDRELLQAYLDAGMSDDEALDRLNLVLDKQIIDISLKVQKQGGTVKAKRDVLGELRSMGKKRLEASRARLIEVRNMQDNLQIVIDDFADLIFQIMDWQPGGERIDITDDAQLYMRFEQMQFIHGEAFKAGAFYDGVLKGDNAFELVESFRAMEGELAKSRSEMHGLLLEEAELLQQIDSNRDDVVDENGKYTMTTTPTRDVEDSGTVFTHPAMPGEIKIIEADANYKAIVGQAQEGTMSVGIDTIQSAEDAAHVLASIRKNAQEGMWAAVTDDAGKVIAVLQHTKGTVDGTSVYPSVFAGAIHQIEGGTKVWFAHNHPSGHMNPSQADLRIQAKMNTVMRGSGVEIQGHVIVGNQTDEFVHLDATGRDQGRGRIRPAARSKKIPIQKRVLKGKAKGPKIDGPRSLETLLERMGHPEGLLLMNNRHEVLGFMALSPQDMLMMRDTGVSARIFKAIADLNVGAMAVSTKRLEDRAHENVQSFGDAADVRIVDFAYIGSDGRMVSRGEQRNMPRSDTTFYQSNIGFTSGLLTAAQTMPQEKGDWKQMLNLIKKQPNVTQAEMDWLDLEAWMEAKGGTITRQEIIDYVDANGIVVEEEIHYDDRAYQGMSLPGGGRKRDFFLKMPEIPEDTLIYSFEIRQDGINEARVDDGVADDMISWSATDDRMNGAVIAREVDQNGTISLKAENINEAQYDIILEQLNARGLQIIDEVVDDFKQQAPPPTGPGLKENFGFSHFSYKNILAWMRTTERITPDGKRILFIEEVQSDWHQKGAKAGYRDGQGPNYGKQAEELRKEKSDLQIKLRRLVKKKNEYYGFDTPGEFVRAMAAEDNWVETWSVTDPEVIELGNLFNEKLQAWADTRELARQQTQDLIDAVPDAPFKGRGWPALAMKRMIRVAAEQGYDSIAWTTGEIQNERNNLATHVERIHYDVKNQRLFADGVPGVRDFQEWVPPHKFEEYMGAGPAAALREEIDRVESFYETFFDDEENQYYVIDGNGEIFRDDAGEPVVAPAEEEMNTLLWEELLLQDLLPQIGGDQIDSMVGEKSRAMPNFYDRELVNTTKKAARRLDREAKVDTTQIFLGDDAPYTVTLEKHQPSTPMGSIGINTPTRLDWFVQGASGRIDGPFEDEAAARIMANQRNENQATVHHMEITPQMRSAALEGQTLFQKKKGSISFDEARKGIIKLTQSRDLSTFLHEAGHLYLELMGSMAETEGAPQQVRDDYQKILEYLGVNNRAEITREHHELWAESFEKYLHEGKAPSVRLQSAFNAFRRWLTDIWSRIKGETPDGIALTPEIRDVMDRILASDDQIALAKQTQSFVQVFSTADQMGVSQEVFDAYKDSIVKTTNDAVERETKRQMAAAGREQRVWWREERAKVKAKVEQEVWEMRVYKAISLLSNGTQPNGEPLEQGSPFKLDKQSLVDRFGEPFLKRLPKPWVYARKGGVDVDVAARQLGYNTAEELVQDLASASKMKDEIEWRTKEIMKLQFPDPLMDGSISEEAIKAVHNDRQANVLAAEMRALRELQRRDKKIVSATKAQLKREDRQAREANKGTLPKRAEIALIKATAKAKIAATRIMDLQPHVWLAAERKAGRLAFEAAARNDYQKAYLYKRAQLVNHEMYRAAVRAKENAVKTNNYLGKFSKPRVQQRLGKLGVIEPILAILEGIELKKVSLKKINERRALQQLAEQIHKGQVVTPISQWLYTVEVNENGTETVVLNEAPFTNWQELKVEEFEAMKDIIKQLEFQAKRKLEMPVNGEMLVLENETEALADSIETNNKEVFVGIGEKTPKARRKQQVKSGVSHWISPSVMANILDAQDWGVVSKRIVVTIRRAIVRRLVPMQQKALLDESRLYREHYTNKELRNLPKKGFAKINGENLSHSDVLSIALNMGNEGNRQALFNGIRVDGAVAYPQNQVEEALAKLTERDWLFVQAVWDYLDSYWPMIQKMEKERRGIAPERVEATPFTVKTADGQEVLLKGGYYPLKYNYEHSVKGENNVFEDHYGNMSSGTYVSASTRAGATHNRVKNHRMVVQLGLHIIGRHLKEITRDIAIGNEVNFVENLLNDKNVRNAMQRTNNMPAYKELKLWLVDVAVGELPANTEMERWIAWARVGFTKSKLAFNLYTAALQLTGYAQSVAVVGAKNMSIAAARIVANPVKAWKQAFEVSQFLKVRYDKTLQAFDKDAMDAAGILREYGTGLPTMGRRAWESFGRWMFWPIAKMQQLVDLTTWYAGYWKGRNEKGLGDFEAIQYADAQVELAQTSGFFSDRSGIERGTLSNQTRQNQFIRIWTTLLSYMARKGNIAYMKTNELKREMTFLNAGKYAIDMMLLFTLEGIASAWIYGRWDWEDEPEELLLQALKESGASAIAGIPFAREIPAAQFGSGNTPIGGLTKDLFTLYVQAQQGEMDPALRKAFVNSFGTMFHLPASQTNRLLEALIDEDDPELLEYLTGTRDD